MQQQATDIKIEDLLFQSEESRIALKKINKNSVTEIATYNHPQPVFLACLKILCILFDCKPDESHTSKYDPEGVFYAAKKQLLSDSFGLLKKLSTFDREELTEDQINKLVSIIEKTDLTVEKVERTSLAMANVAQWELALLHARQYEIELKPLLANAQARKKQLE